jgi:mRNA interferase HicA
MKATELKRWLEKQGCHFQPSKGGHMKVFLGKRMSILPMHGAGKEIGKGLLERIKRDLGLK